MSNPEFRARLRAIAPRLWNQHRMDTLAISKACNTTEAEVIRALDMARGFIHYERAPSVSELRSSARCL